jgi:hypothetical protein
MPARVHPLAGRGARAAALALALTAAVLAGVWVARVASPQRTVQVVNAGLSERLVVLDRVRVSTRAALRRADSADAQARLAGRLAGAHLAAADALAGTADASVVRALARAGAAYAALGRAARAGSPAAFEAARRGVRVAESALARAVRGQPAATVVTSSTRPSPLLLGLALGGFAAAALLVRRRRPRARHAAASETAAAHWICEVDWRAGLRSAAFRVIASAPGAHDVTIARSAGLDWPPGMPPTPTPELGDALEMLERRLTQSGWEPIAPGGDWYARRFTWTRAEPPEPLGTVTAAEAGWTCEIGWKASLRGAAFVAFAAAADGPSRLLARSANVDSPPLLPPQPTDDLVAALDALGRALVECGWTPAGCGPSWYARRFAWRHSEAPEPLAAPVAA